MLEHNLTDNELYEKIQKYLKFDLKTESASGIRLTPDVVAILPTGWVNLISILFQSMDLLFARITRLYVKDGIMKVEFENKNQLNESFHVAQKWLANSFMKATSMKCMIDPEKRGWRRKNYDGYPCLCTELNIIYANELANHERNTET